jgi:hypothetical protein
MFLNKIDVLDRKFVPMFVTVISIPISHEHRYTGACNEIQAKARSSTVQYARAIGAVKLTLPRTVNSGRPFFNVIRGALMPLSFIFYTGSILSFP